MRVHMELGEGVGSPVLSLFALFPLDGVSRRIQSQQQVPAILSLPPSIGVTGFCGRA